MLIARVMLLTHNAAESTRLNVKLGPTFSQQKRDFGQVRMTSTFTFKALCSCKSSLYGMGPEASLTGRADLIHFEEGEQGISYPLDDRYQT